MIDVAWATLRSQFQFLSRNSVRWDAYACVLLQQSVVSFNSSVGILSVGTRVVD